MQKVIYHVNNNTSTYLYSDNHTKGKKNKKQKYVKLEILGPHLNVKDYTYMYANEKVF